MMPENENDRQDELGAEAEEKKGAGSTAKNAIKGGSKATPMIHDMPQDEQMHDEFGKDGEALPPGEGG
ncbi:MAG: hypothetical protein INR69_01370 [Mucilaginibacter polytrichastri]|nr:hypothetical protein [Mucilaginibacter polytrichastri]